MSEKTLRSAREARMIRSLKIPKNAALLDVACGFGEHMRALHNLGYRNITGVDINERIIEEARKNHNLPIIQADWRHLPFAPESIDFAYMFYSGLGLIKDPNELPNTLDEISRVLKPHAKFLFFTRNGDDILEYYQQHKGFHSIEVPDTDYDGSPITVRRITFINPQYQDTHSSDVFLKDGKQIDFHSYGSKRFRTREQYKSIFEESGLPIVKAFTVQRDPTDYESPQFLLGQKN